MTSPARVHTAVVHLLGEQELVVADVGAAYGLPAHLKVLENIATLCLFEPNPDRAQELQVELSSKYKGAKAHVLSIALAGASGQRTLFVTNVATGSSLLRPGSAAALERGDPGYFFPYREVQVETQSLQQALPAKSLDRLDFTKLDVQGAELEVLKGMGERMASDLLGVETEIGFPGGYIDQPGFGMVSRHLDSIGLELFDLKPVRGHRYRAGGSYPEAVFGVTPSARSLSPRLWEVDALFFRPVDQLLKARDLGAIRRLAVLQCAYGFFPEAHDAIERAHTAGLVGRHGKEDLQARIQSWHRLGRYSVFDSLRWHRWTQRPRSFARRIRRRLFGPRLAGWTDE